ncbi:MAG TPA: type II toxin-antitoxin system RelE/ParE family toxin [Granulicella sp.]|nr:type II toxin-antitoxin system RelE/ParE family toxin [Granulicella sp.]
MSEGAAPSRLSIDWSIEARADLRAIDRHIARDLLQCVDRYLASRHGDVKRLKAPMDGFRLRCGDYRIFFKQAGENGISVTGVRHRRNAYR